MALCKPGMFEVAVCVGPWRIQGLLVRGLTYWGPSASACSGPWHIHGPGVFRAPVCSGRWHVRGRVGHLRWVVLRGWLGAMAIFSGHDYFGGVGLSRSLVYWVGVVGWSSRGWLFCVVGYGALGGAGPVGFSCSRWYIWVGCAICGWGQFWFVGAALPGAMGWGLLNLGFKWGSSDYATTIFWFILLSFYLWR